MANDIQKWYKALEEADRRAQTGDEAAKEDAYRIAETIRQLEAQAPEPTEASLTTPALWGALGAAPPAIKSFKEFVTSTERIPTPAPVPEIKPTGLPGIDIDRQFEGTPGPGGTGRSRDTTYNVRTKEISEAAKKTEDTLESLRKKGIVSGENLPQIAGSTRAGVLLTHGGLSQIDNPPMPTTIERFSQAIKNAPSTAAGAVKALPRAAVTAAGNLPLRSTVGGFAGGSLAADAYNYKQLAEEAAARGDTEAAAYYTGMMGLSGVGSAGGFSSAVAKKHFPKTRALAIPAAGLSLYNYLQSQQGYPAPGDTSGSVMGKATGGAIKGYANLGKVEAVKSGLNALKKAFAPKPTNVVRASEALGPHEGKYLYVTESDRMRSTGGDLGGPGFSKFQLEDPRYAEAQAAWGVAKKGKASEMLNINKRFPKDKIIWSPLIGSEGQHRSNQHVYDMLANEFSRQASAGKLSPELREAMNTRLATWKDYVPLKMQGIDVANPEMLKEMGNTFDRRAAIAEVLGGKGIGGRKGQIFDYPGIMQEMTDPMVVGAPTHSVGTRLFSLSGDVDYRPDLHSAFPYILKGEDKAVAFSPVPKELMLNNWTEQVRDFLGREPGTMDFLRGVKEGHGRPNAFLSQELLRKLEDAGYKTGGLASIK